MCAMCGASSLLGLIDFDLFIIFVSILLALKILLRLWVARRRGIRCLFPIEVITFWFLVICSSLFIPVLKPAFVLRIVKVGFIERRNVFVKYF